MVPRGLRGNHHLLKFQGANTNLVSINVHKTIVKLNNSIFHVNSKTIKNQVSDFFNIESLGTALISSNCENCKEVCNDNLIQNDNITIKAKRELELIKRGFVYNQESKQWTVSYPRIKDAILLPNNFAAAWGHLKSLEKRLIKSSRQNVELYCDQITDMLNRNVAKKLTSGEIADYHGPVHYIPHHGVYKSTSSSTPLRIIFNSSSSFMGNKTIGLNVQIC